MSTDVERAEQLECYTPNLTLATNRIELLSRVVLCRRRENRYCDDRVIMNNWCTS